MHHKLSVICQKAKNSILHVFPYAPVPYKIHGLCCWGGDIVFGKAPDDKWD